MVDIGMTEEDLAREVRDLAYAYHAGFSGVIACAVWWEDVCGKAMEGDATARFKLVGAFGMLAIWVSRTQATEVAVLAVGDGPLKQISEPMVEILDLAREANSQVLDSTKPLSDMAWQYIRSEPEGARLLFGALIGLARPMLELERGDVAETETIAFQELCDSKGDPARIKRTWDALATMDGELSLQLKVLIRLAGAAISTAGPPPYPGLDVDVVSWTAFQIAVAIAGSDLQLAQDVGVNFLLVCHRDHSYRLAEYLLARIQ